MPDRSSTRRNWLWKNGHRKCHYCGKHLQKKGKNMLTADHVIPKSKGGTDRRSNLVACCYECNQAKRSRDAGDFEQIVFTRAHSQAQRTTNGLCVMNGNGVDFYVEVLMESYRKYVPETLSSRPLAIGPNR